MSKNKINSSKFDKYLQEEEFFLKDRKKYRKQRKQKSKLDRSKYKKTDIQKQKKVLPKTNHFKKGLVLSIFGEEIKVRFNKKHFRCSLRGLLKKEKTKNKNILAVGDRVFITIKNDQGVIEDIEPRVSILSRTDEKRKKQNIIAVNIDQVLITSSIDQPRFKPFLIDRYIIATTKGNMHPIIIINKTDLLKKTKLKEKQKIQNFIKIYKKLGYKILLVSFKDKVGLNSLLKAMKNKTSVFSGQSGTGKSSLINAVLHTKLKTGSLIKKTYKGAHITTKSELVEIKTGGFCIDTPGIKSFGIWDLKIEDIKDYFFEFKKFKNCKYENCLHLEEPHCKIKEALDEKKISSLRFDSYRSLIKEAIDKKRTSNYE